MKKLLDMAYSLGFLEFLTFLYRYKNSDKPRGLRFSDSRCRSAESWQLDLLSERPLTLDKSHALCSRAVVHFGKAWCLDTEPNTAEISDSRRTGILRWVPTLGVNVASRVHLGYTPGGRQLDGENPVKIGSV